MCGWCSAKRARPWYVTLGNFRLTAGHGFQSSTIVMTNPRGVLPYIRYIYIGMCWPKGYGFWAALVWKRVYIVNILVWNWVWLLGERSRKLINLFLFPATGASNWWERKRNRQNISFKLNFTYSSLKRWPFSTDAYAMLNHVQGQVWKRVWIFEARSENRCGKWHFLVWNWVWNWRCGRHTPTKNSKAYPYLYLFIYFFFCFIANHCLSINLF